MLIGETRKRCQEKIRAISTNLCSRPLKMHQSQLQSWPIPAEMEVWDLVRTPVTWAWCGLVPCCTKNKNRTFEKSFRKPMPQRASVIRRKDIVGRSNKELLAMVLAVELLMYYLTGCPFTVAMDILAWRGYGTLNKEPEGMVAQWIKRGCNLSTSKIVHRLGKDHGNGLLDTLQDHIRSALLKSRQWMG